MKVLVTGGTGFAGSHLVKRLLERGHEVRVLDNKPGLAPDELRARGAEIQTGSVTDKETVYKVVEGCELVFHLAAAFRELNVAKSYYRDVNSEGTRIVADACLRFGVQRMVYCSTCGVHGSIAHPPGDEDSPIAPEDDYQQTKYHGELVVQQAVKEGLNAVILRPAAIYGPGDPERFAMLFRQVKRGRFYMFGDGNTYYHPLFVDNLTDAFELAASRPLASGSVYLIADERFWTLNELVQRVANAMAVSVRIVHLPFLPIWCAACVCESCCRPLGIKPPIFPRRVAWFRQDRAFSIEKARRDLDFNPQVGIDDGLRRTACWYREHKII